MSATTTKDLPRTARFDPPKEAGDVMRGHKMRVLRRDESLLTGERVIVEDMDAYCGQFSVPREWLKEEGK